MFLMPVFLMCMSEIQQRFFFVTSENWVFIYSTGSKSPLHLPSIPYQKWVMPVNSHSSACFWTLGTLQPVYSVTLGCNPLMSVRV
ncbi:hypothetical protein GDO86_007308 [Hymenochirus boettgeri]|uniref:Uncharacterized protein n=1 Tax=Hymenochirus boettgeri TaxID=247094 RepID=A0A8T2IWU8_9PIPI|nr:hypothetical protein GDO86_007308 [Hymenochirus boettgeri]